MEYATPFLVSCLGLERIRCYGILRNFNQRFKVSRSSSRNIRESYRITLQSLCENLGADAYVGLICTAYSSNQGAYVYVNSWLCLRCCKRPSLWSFFLTCFVPKRIPNVREVMPLGEKEDKKLFMCLYIGNCN